MLLNEFQEKARTFAIYKEGLTYSILGLCSESGEVAQILKKTLRDHDGILSEERKGQLKSEVSDVLWYLANICSDLGTTLEEIAQININKLTSRKERDCIKGSGDYR